MKRIIKGVLVVAILSFGGLNSEHRRMEQVFNRWIDKNDAHFQRVYRDINLESMMQGLDAGRRKLFNERFFTYRDKLNSFGKFFTKTKTHPSLAMNVQENDEFTAQAKRELATVFGLMQNDVAGFISYLKKAGFEDEELNKKEAAAYYYDVIDQHKGLMSVLFARADSVLENECLFTVANHFFEFCFSSPTWKNFNSILKTTKDYPIARLIYSTMWYNLAGNGWKDWHKSTLITLQEKCRQPGQYVTYIAGGSDIYQLLDHEIYTINIIDPMLPSQPQYYSEGWDWLVRGAGADGGINDELSVKTKHKNLILRRESYKEQGAFSAYLSTNEQKEIPKSLTVWSVCDKESGQKIGVIRFDRRFCKQADFETKPGQNLLVSFNELYFITTFEDDNWGINPKKFSDDFTMFVKQLRRPVNKEVACHLRQADCSQLGFIRLGSATN